MILMVDGEGGKKLPLLRIPIYDFNDEVVWVTPDATNLHDHVYFVPVGVGGKGIFWRAVRDDALMRVSAAPTCWILPLIDQ